MFFVKCVLFFVKFTCFLKFANLQIFFSDLPKLHFEVVEVFEVLTFLTLSTFDGVRVRLRAGASADKKLLFAAFCFFFGGSQTGLGDRSAGSL